MAAVPSIRSAPIRSHSADETSDLYGRFHKQIFAFCLRELGNREEAEDATQSTFLNAFRALESGTVFEHESAWLYQAAHHVCQTRRRSWYRRRQIESDGDFDRLQHIIASPTSDDDELFGLRPALESMPEQQRKALLLREWQGLTYAEIATELDLSQSAVETLLFRARRSLAERLVDDPAEQRAKVGRTGDFGSLGAAIKALFFSGGIKIAATLATVAATTVVASAPTVRNDVVHFVAPSLPQPASTVKHKPHVVKAIGARTASVVTPVVAPATPAPVVKTKTKPPRVVHHALRRPSVVVVPPPAVTTTTPKVPSVSTTPTVKKTPVRIAPIVPPVATPTDPTPTTTDATTTTATTTTVQSTSTTPDPTPAYVPPAKAVVPIVAPVVATPPAPVGPTLTGFSPSSGQIGTNVSIGGGPFTHVSSVKFNGVAAVFSGQGAVLVAKVPVGATSGPITVTNATGTSTTAGSFTVVAPPAPVFLPSVASFSPGSATVGATVSIVGAHLTGATAVKFNGVAATFTPGSDSQLTAVVPAGATSGPISVTTPAGTITSSAALTILALPTVSSFSPASGVVGATVTIGGSHLSSASVKFNGVSATVLSSSDSSLSVQVPASATTGPISVTTSTGTATAGTFTVLALPTIGGFSPSNGVAGTPVTITGAHFTGATAVTLNGVAVQFAVVSDSQLTFTVPAGATSGPIAVTTPSGNVSSASGFTVSVPTPSLSGLSPVFARAGTSVTISGAHLTGTTSVKFNGVSASFTVNSDSQLTAVVPSSATTGPVTVTTPAGTATSMFFVSR